VLFRSLAVPSVTWSPDGRKLVSSGPIDPEALNKEPAIELWDAASAYDEHP
jgi:hypothetical protein